MLSLILDVPGVPGRDFPWDPFGVAVFLPLMLQDNALLTTVRMSADSQTTVE